MRLSLILMSLLMLQACFNSVSTEKAPNTPTIYFALPEASHLLVWVENSYQTKVETVVHAKLQKGTHVFPLKMEDKDDKPLPYGIYTYYIKTEKYNVSRTLVYSKPTNNY